MKQECTENFLWKDPSIFTKSLWWESQNIFSLFIKMLLGQEKKWSGNESKWWKDNEMWEEGQIFIKNPFFSMNHFFLFWIKKNLFLSMKIHSNSRRCFCTFLWCWNVIISILLEISGLENVFVFLLFCCYMVWPANISGYGLNYDFYSLKPTLKTAKATANSGSTAKSERDQVFESDLHSFLALSLSSYKTTDGLLVLSLTQFTHLEKGSSIVPNPQSGLNETMYVQNQEQTHGNKYKLLHSPC